MELSVLCNVHVFISVFDQKLTKVTQFSTLHPEGKVFDTLNSIPKENKQIMAPYLDDEDQDGSQSIVPLEWVEENKEKLKASARKIY